MPHLFGTLDTQLNLTTWLWSQLFDHYKTDLFLNAPDISILPFNRTWGHVLAAQQFGRHAPAPKLQLALLKAGLWLSIVIVFVTKASLSTSVDALCSPATFSVCTGSWGRMGEFVAGQSGDWDQATANISQHKTAASGTSMHTRVAVNLIETVCVSEVSLTSG